MVSSDVSLTNAEKIGAYKIMAEQTAAILNAQSQREERLLCVGNYFITCMVAAPDHSLEAIRSTFADGLVNAGLPTEKALEVSDTYNRWNNQHWFVSLSHVPDDQSIPGVIRGRVGNTTKTSISLDESTFIRGILQAKYEAASSAG